jgi:fumarate hydratase class II
VDGIEADREQIAALVENSLAAATALAPAIGYDNAAAVVKEAYRSRRSARQAGD